MRKPFEVTSNGCGMHIERLGDALHRRFGAPFGRVRLWGAVGCFHRKQL